MGTCKNKKNIFYIQNLQDFTLDWIPECWNIYNLEILQKEE